MRIGATRQIRSFSGKRVSLALQTNFKNTNNEDIKLLDGKRTQYGVRSDVNFTQGRHRLETGVYIRSLSEKSVSEFFNFFTGTLEDFTQLNHQGTEESFTRRTRGATNASA